MKEKLNLLQLRSSIERELRAIGAVISQCSETDLQFKGGAIIKRSVIILVGGTIEVTESNSISCSAKISVTTVFGLLMAGTVMLPLSLLAKFFLPLGLLLLFAAALVIFMSWGSAEQWLYQVVERAMVQQGVQADGLEVSSGSDVPQ